MQGKMSEIGLMMMQCERAMRARAIRNVRLNSAGGTKQFVMFRESGIERRPKLWNVKMAQGRRSKGEARYAYAPGRSSAVFLFGRMGRWNCDRDCEPGQLIVAARMGEPGRELPPRSERRNPVPVAPRRGFAIGHSTASRAPVVCQGRIFSPMSRL